MRINEWCKERKPQLKILVAGKIAVGKSSLVNCLIGRKVARTGMPATQVTRDVNRYECKFNGVDIIIVDTPGLLGPDLQTHLDHETLQQIYQGTEGAIDLLLVCLNMTTRFDQTDILVIQKLKQIFKDTIWKNTLFVLTHANVISLEYQSGAPPQPVDETEQKEHFENFLSIYREGISGLFQSHIPANLLKEIPVVPAGNKNPNLPGYGDWLSKFWIKAFTRSSESGKVELMRIPKDRFTKNLSFCTLF